MTTLHQLEARRDQLVADLCQLHLDELGASLSGDEAGAAEAGALMTAVQAEIAEIEREIAQREEERARIEADHGPFSLPHAPVKIAWRGQTREELERHATAAEAAWIDHYTASNAYHAIPHDAPDSERHSARKRMERTLEALRRAEERDRSPRD